jgi:hypothetical protein
VLLPTAQFVAEHTAAFRQPSAAPSISIDAFISTRQHPHQPQPKMRIAGSSGGSSAPTSGSDAITDSSPRRSSSTAVRQMQNEEVIQLRNVSHRNDTTRLM